MKIVVHRDNLQRAVGLVERVTAKNAALPILSNILLVAEGGRLRLSATNLETGVTAVIAAKSDANGRVAVPGRILGDLARAAQGDTVSLSLKQNVLTIESGAYKTTVLCFDAAEYPIIPKIEGGVRYTVQASDVLRLFTSVADSIAASESRPELAGAYLRFASDGTIAAATDSFRLVERTMPAKHGSESSAIVPRATVLEALRLLSGVESEVEVRIADNQISLIGEDFELVSRLVDGRYPDYRKVVPERFLSKALVRRDQLENAIKVAALFSSSISDVKLQCQEKTFSVSAKNASKGEGEATIEAALKGEPFDISLNYHYLLDGLKAIQDEKVVMQFTGKGSPFVMRPASEDPTVYIIMPLRG